MKVVEGSWGLWTVSPSTVPLPACAFFPSGSVQRPSANQRQAGKQQRPNCRHPTYNYRISNACVRSGSNSRAARLITRLFSATIPCSRQLRPHENTVRVKDCNLSTARTYLASGVWHASNSIHLILGCCEPPAWSIDQGKTHPPFANICHKCRCICTASFI